MWIFELITTILNTKTFLNVIIILINMLIAVFLIGLMIFLLILVQFSSGITCEQLILLSLITKIVNETCTNDHVKLKHNIP
jgi:hypothetical protein